MTGDFAAERASFARLVAALRTDGDLRRDLERAFELLLSRYATSIRENRFIVGGVTERFIAAAFCAIDEQARNVGAVTEGSDVRVGDALFSVKGSFSGSREFRLVNVLGESPSAEWRHGTIFVVSERGVGYADPGLLPGRTRRKRDAVVLPVRPVFELWEVQPELLAPIVIPRARRDQAGSDVASKTVADEILRYGMKKLRPMDPRPPWDDA